MHLTHDDVIKWKHFPRYWPFVRVIHRSLVNSPHEGQWRGALMFTLICTRINGWVNNRGAGDLRRYRTHYDVILMSIFIPVPVPAIWAVGCCVIISLQRSRILLSQWNKGFAPSWPYHLMSCTSHSIFPQSNHMSSGPLCHYIFTKVKNPVAILKRGACTVMALTPHAVYISLSIPCRASHMTSGLLCNYTVFAPACNRLIICS